MAFRTTSRSPESESSITCTVGPTNATNTRPASEPSDGPGPATPVVAIAQVEPKDLIAPRAISITTSSLTTECSAIADFETLK